MSYQPDKVSLSARQLLLEKTFEIFDRMPPGPIAALRREGGDRFVPGDGTLDPKAILVGEAPGFYEDRDGLPFVGNSGRFLDELLQVYARLNRADIWITNIVKYRPPENRTPTDDEIEASRQLLAREVALVAGREIVPIIGLGRAACSAMAGAPISVGATHGSWVGLNAGWNMFVSYHPAAGLRNVAIRKRMRADFQQLGRELNEQADS